MFKVGFSVGSLHTIGIRVRPSEQASTDSFLLGISPGMTIAEKMCRNYSPSGLEWGSFLTVNVPKSPQKAPSFQGLTNPHIKHIKMRSKVNAIKEEVISVSSLVFKRRDVGLSCIFSFLYRDCHRDQPAHPCSAFPYGPRYTAR